MVAGIDRAHFEPSRARSEFLAFLDGWECALSVGPIVPMVYILTLQTPIVPICLVYTYVLGDVSRAPCCSRRAVL